MLLATVPIMQAIKTRYLGPTNTKGSRIKASCDAKSIIVPWDYEKSTTDNHWAACIALKERLGWTGNMAMGSLGGDFVFVFLP